MLIPCKTIARILETSLASTVQSLKTENIHPKLVTILHGESPEQISFVTIKRRIAERLGIGFEFIHYPDIPPFETFLSELQLKVQASETTGVIIQHPLPQSYNKNTMYEAIPTKKEIEGHKNPSSYQFPLSLAVLTGIKYIYAYALSKRELDDQVIVDFEKDIPFFKQILAGKKIVISGRGGTGGKPIGECLSIMGIPFTTIHSQTSNPEELYAQADIIITATGKHIINSTMIKKDVILLNVGLRKEEGKLRGDYDEEEIKDTASFYTETPGGLGPLDVLYLYKNLLDAI